MTPIDVAEENIMLCPLTRTLAQEFIDKVPQFSRYFDYVEIRDDGWGRFLPSPETRSAYPEDDDLAREWIRLGLYT